MALLSNLGFLRALRHRNYRLFFSGQVISFVGTWMQITAQGWLVYDLTHSVAWLGIISFLTFLPMLVFSLIGGSIADRVNKRRMILSLQYVALALAVIYASLLWTNAITIHWVAVLAFAMGVVNAFETPARQALVVDLVGKEDLPYGIALNSAMFNGARLLGPAIAGVVIASIGVAWCMLSNAISYIFGIAALAAIRVQPAQTHGTASNSLWRSIHEIYVYIRRTRPVWGLLLLVSITTVFGWSYSVVLPVFAEDILGGGALQLGKLLSASGFGAFTSAIFVVTIGSRFLPRQLLLSGLTVFVVSLIVFSVSRLSWLSNLAMAAVGFGLIMFYVNSNSALQRRVPDHLRGRIMGIYVLSFGGLMPVGSLQIGFIAEHLGVTAALVLNAAVCGITAFVASRVIPRLARTPAEVAQVPDIQPEKF